MLLPYWNRSGQVHQLEPYPESFEDWKHGEDLSPARQNLHDAVKAVTKRTVARTRCKAMDMNITLDTTFDDDSSVIVRQRHGYTTDPVAENWSLAKFQAEIHLLRWLSDNSRIPVPSVIAVGTTGSEFSIQEKMMGTTLAREWHSLSSSAKDQLMSDYVDIVLELFHLTVPQRIGSVSANWTESGVVNIGPRLSPNPNHSGSKVFDDMFEYVQFLVALKRQAERTMTPGEQLRAEETLSHVQSKALSLLETINDPLLLRCVLTHGDLHTYNILINTTGYITSVLDWEINYVQPGVLSAEYPMWLSDEGVCDPRFASDNYWWEESPAERRRLCAVFEEMVLDRDPQFHKCLIEGRDIRAIVSWLTDTSVDPGFDRMRSWVTSRFA